MSKFNLIAVAIAAALAAPAAFATTVTVFTPGPPIAVGPEVLPSNAFTGPTIVASNSTKAVTILADATSVYLGRTTGYNIRLTLSQGLFSSNPAATAIGTGSANPVSLAGGGNGANTATFSVTPAGTGVVQGDGIQLAATAININGVAALGTGGSINVAVQVFDPVGGNQLGSTINATLINTVQGWVVTYTGGAATQRIDVGSASAKRYFGTATVGSGLEATLFNAGRVQVALNSTLTNSMGLSLTTATAPVTIAGTDFAAFKTVTGGTGGSIYLATADTCPMAGSIPAVVAVGNQSAAIATATTAAAVNTAGYLCFDSNAITAITAQPISSSLAVAQASTITAPTVSSGSTLTAMTFNGSVVNVMHFNPASNAAQQSYLRVTNGSATAGLVSVAAVCDNGAAAPTTASFTLGAGQSRLLTSQTLESGVGLTSGTGACAVSGKSRLTVTGEFAPMAVQNFLRNSTSAGLINTNVNNED